MIIYNITTKVSSAVDADWLQWQQEENIPEIMAMGFFISYRLFRLLEQDDSEGNTYIIQFTATAQEQYHLFMTTHAAMLRQKAFKKWHNRFISFSSILEVIH